MKRALFPLRQVCPATILLLAACQEAPTQAPVQLPVASSKVEPGKEGGLDLILSDERGDKLIINCGNGLPVVLIENQSLKGGRSGAVLATFADNINGKSAELVRDPGRPGRWIVRDSDAASDIARIATRAERMSFASAGAGAARDEGLRGWDIKLAEADRTRLQVACA